jgi:hypothetical protein
VHKSQHRSTSSLKWFRSGTSNKHKTPCNGPPTTRISRGRYTGNTGRPICGPRGAAHSTEHVPRTVRGRSQQASVRPRGKLPPWVEVKRWGIPAPAILRDQTVTLSDRQPMTFLCLAPGPSGAPEVAVLHRLMRFMDMTGKEVSGFHDRVLGLVGDIMPHQYPTVDVPGTTFHLVNTPVRVPTMAAMNAILSAWDDPATPLGPTKTRD